MIGDTGTTMGTTSIEGAFYLSMVRISPGPCSAGMVDNSLICGASARDGGDDWGPELRGPDWGTVERRGIGEERDRGGDE